MSEREEKRGGSGCVIGCLLMLFLLPVLYVLGVGPAAWFDSQLPSPSGSPLLRTIYEPLQYLADKCEPIDSAIHWYVSFWK
jgi:hypothetical protein